MSLPENISNILATVTRIPSEFRDLGWDTDGCPDGEKCDEFEILIGNLSSEANKAIDASKISEEEEAKRGAAIAAFLNLKRGREHADRWDIPGGNSKTNLGLFRTLKAFIDGTHK